MAELPLRELVDSATDGVAIFTPIVDRAGVIVDFCFEYLNPVGAAIIKFDSDEVLGRGLVEVSPEVRASGLFERYVSAYEGTPFVDEVEYRSERASGVFAIRVSRHADHLVIRYRDVTAARELERSSRTIQQQLMHTLEHMSDAFFVLDRQWRFRYVNDQAERVLGRTRDELLGLVVWDEFPDAVGSEFETVYRRVAATGEAETFEAYYPQPLDTWYSVRAHPGDDGVSVFFQDIGPQRRLQSRLQQAQRLESVATLSGGIAHDFNNLLTVMSGHVALLREDLGDDHPNHLDVDAISDAVHRASDLTRQMLTFSRRQVLRPRLTDLNELVRHNAPLIRRLLTDANGMVIQLHPAPVMVEVDPGEFTHGLMALAANAVDAMGPGGQLTLQTGLTYLADPPASLGREVDPGWYGVVSVSDDGHGMDPGVLERAFEPFFTTKGPGQGTGLGLSVVHGMARQVGGEVTIYSEPDLGTTVRLYLPRAVDDLPEPPDETPSHRGGHETVLVVDDDDRVRHLVERVLGDHGYRVVAATDPHHALATLDDLEGGIDLLVTDVVMPGGSGHELAASIEQRRGPVPVLFVSGYTGSTARDGAPPTLGGEFLAKPFAPADLAAAVRRILDGRHA